MTSNGWEEMKHQKSFHNEGGFGTFSTSKASDFILHNSSVFEITSTIEFEEKIFENSSSVNIIFLYEDIIPRETSSNS
jgi:hypothetical protein